MWIFGAVLLGLVASSYAQTNAQIQAVTEELWSLDVNRGTTSQVVYDKNTAGRLFSHVDSGLMGRATYSRFNNLRTKYNPVIGEPDECLDAECSQSQNNYLDAVIATSVMSKAHEFLVTHGQVGSGASEWRQLLKDTWFKPYSRSQGAALDSCGFEHVFLGEIRSSGVTGFHNWVQFYREEANGFINWGGSQGTCPNNLEKFGMTWSGYTKSVSSMWIRTSPEFEMAIYTICFHTRSGSCATSINGSAQTITTYDMSGISPRTVGTAYPPC
eukprot:GHVU01040356.1.p1 GENE.GHVU01040356.1~~GHVU01040356.1.p1  ORF type:complete len:271 (+),score=19.14 GHVU01040356.1:60-872(+)